jgi:hypothetical protein
MGERKSLIGCAGAAFGKGRDGETGDEFMQVFQKVVRKTLILFDSIL